MAIAGRPGGGGAASYCCQRAHVHLAPRQHTEPIKQARSLSQAVSQLRNVKPSAGTESVLHTDTHISRSPSKDTCRQYVMEAATEVSRTTEELPSAVSEPSDAKPAAALTDAVAETKPEVVATTPPVAEELIATAAEPAAASKDAPAETKPEEAATVTPVAEEPVATKPTTPSKDAPAESKPEESATVPPVAEEPVATEPAAATTEPKVAEKPAEPAAESVKPENEQSDKPESQQSLPSETSSSESAQAAPAPSPATSADSSVPSAATGDSAPQDTKPDAVAEASEKLEALALKDEAATPETPSDEPAAEAAAETEPKQPAAEADKSRKRRCVIV